MNTDIRIKTTFPEHIKTKKLIKKLGYKGFYSLICLWCYVAVNKPRGILSGMTAEDIAICANWDEDSENFVDALIQCGFLEKTNGGEICLHDWEEHNPYAAQAELRSAVARLNALKRWGKQPTGNLLRHPDPTIRSCVAKEMTTNRWQRITKKMATDALSDGLSDTTQSLDTSQSNASGIANCNAPSPSPIPSPSPTPTIYVADSDLSLSTHKRVFFENVLLSEKEHEKLIHTLGQEKTEDYIARLNDYIHQIGQQKARAKYKSHYHVILNWHRRDMAEVERRLRVAEVLQKKREEEYFR